LYSLTVAPCTPTPPSREVITYKGVQNSGFPKEKTIRKTKSFHVNNKAENQENHKWKNWTTSIDGLDDILKELAKKTKVSKQG